MPMHPKNVSAMKNPKEKVLVLGAGGVGAWVAKALVERGHDVFATTTNAQTVRALSCLGIHHVDWRWEPGASWACLQEVEASRWIVTVPPRMGPEKSMAFHCALHEAAAACRVKRLVWTSSTAVYDPTQSGTLVEADAGHHTSRHTGVDMLALEDVHRNGDVPFVAMRFGGLFGQGRHPVKALLKRGTVQGGDGHVQWVHEEDAAAACVFTALHEGPLPDALNVVAPEVRTRRELLHAAFPANLSVDITPGGVQRKVSSQALTALGFSFQVKDPLRWVQTWGAVTDEGVGEGPHGPLNWTRHPARRTAKGCALMVHGYKGFRHWGLWRGLAERWAEEGWDVYRMDFSHNGHVAPFTEDCLDEAAWSENRYHYEAEAVAFALQKLAEQRGQLVVLGHSRGGGMAVLGARPFQKAGGSLTGVACWAPVSDVFARFPWGPALKDWEASDRLEVLNGRTGQTLVHPYAFYLDAKARESELNIESAATALTCPVLVVHGTDDAAVGLHEGKAIASWATQGTLATVEGANHVFGMAHPWTDATQWPEHLAQAWEAQKEWLQSLT